MADSSALCFSSSFHPLVSASRSMESSSSSSHPFPPPPSISRFSGRRLRSLRLLRPRARDSDEGGIFGDDPFGPYPWESSLPPEGESTIQWVPEDRVTLFTTEGLIQIGGSLVPRRFPSSDKLKGKSKAPHRFQRFLERDYMDPEQGLCLGALFDIAATNGLDMGRRLCIFGFCRSIEMLSDVVEDTVLEHGGETRVDLLKDSIYVNGNRLSKKLPPKLYFALNKPKGYICSIGEESKSVISLFDEYWKSWNKINPGLPKPRLFTVGRLDVATTGLIFVTNDGDFAQRLAHPSSNITKEYIAAVEGAVHRRHLIALSEGTQIEGVQCVPDSVELLPVQPGASRPRIRIVVHEGRNHEVRELVNSAGLKLHSLKRVRIGGFRLPSDLGLGKYAELKESELKLFGGKT